MSQDERVPLPVDDGEIHEWLDGELHAERAAELEALTHTSPEFAQRVAEARGLIAASSRILGALDDVPSRVLPSKSGPPVVGGAGNAPVHVARRWSWRRVSSIAALLMVGVTGVLVVRREPALSEPDALVRAEASPSQAAPAESAAMAFNVVATDAATSSTDTRERTATTATTSEAAAAAAPLEPVRPTAVSASAIASELPGAPASVNRAAQLGSEASARRTAQINIDSQVAVQLKTSQEERRMQLRAAPSVQGAARFSSGSVLSASDAGAGQAIGSTDTQSDVLPADLLLGIQRVECTANCVQLRIEVARDGRLRRWMQSLGSATIADTATLSETTLTALTQRIAALQLETLPAILRLDGSKCRTVGSLRESLRVSFVHDNAPRQVMGLPWCTDGSHVLDRAAQLIQDAATLKLGPVSR